MECLLIGGTVKRFAMVVVVLSFVMLSANGCGVLQERYKAQEAQANAASSASWSAATQAQAMAYSANYAEAERTARLQTLAMYFGRNDPDALIHDLFWGGACILTAGLLAALAVAVVLRAGVRGA